MIADAIPGIVVGLLSFLSLCVSMILFIITYNKEDVSQMEIRWAYRLGFAGFMLFGLAIVITFY